LKDELYKKSSFLKHVCYCRTNIMERYIDSVSNLTLMLTGFFLDTNEMKNNDVELRKEILQRYFYTFKQQAYGLFKNGDLLNYKTLLIFKKMQSCIEDRIFKRIENDYELLLEEKENNGDFVNVDDMITINEYHTYILDYMHMLGEIAILTISSLKVNCENISDSIYDDVGDIPDDIIKSYREKTNNFVQMGATCHRRDTEVPIQEVMHIFLTDDYMEDSAGFVKHCVDLINKYYKNPENLKLILDFGLSESDTLCTNGITEILKLNDIKQIYLTNCLDIDFCDNMETVKQLYIDKNGIKKLCQN